MPITQGDETTGRELVTSNLLSHLSGSRWLLAGEGCLPVARGTGTSAESRLLLDISAELSLARRPPCSAARSPSPLRNDG